MIIIYHIDKQKYFVSRSNQGFQGFKKKVRGSHPVESLLACLVLHIDSYFVNNVNNVNS